jgi:hypothetical protein
MEQWQLFLQVLIDLAKLVGSLLSLAGQWWLLIAWFAWWLLAVNWKKVWPVLAQGAWLPVLFLLVIAALAWSRMFPSHRNVLGVTVANFWWQFGATLLLGASALFAGWVQGLIGWTPVEVELEPPASADSHGHAHH